MKTHIYICVFIKAACVCAGYYRIMYQGDKKEFGTIVPFSGFTNTFKVLASGESDVALAAPAFSVALTARLSTALKRLFHP
jgi:hypothetical protein